MENGCFVTCNGVSKKSPQVFIKVHKIHKTLSASRERKKRKRRFRTPYMNDKATFSNAGTDRERDLTRLTAKNLQQL